MISHEGLTPCSNECPCPDQAPGPGQMLRGPVPSGRAAPALCHAHCPVLPAAISAVKTTDRFGSIYVSLILLHYILHVYKSPGRSQRWALNWSNN